MAYPHIENTSDYAQFCDAFKSGTEDLEHGSFSAGYWTCPECDNAEWTNCDPCPECETDPDTANEPHFSWSPCDICGRHLGGDREHVIGWLEGAEGHDYADSYQWEGNACTDCIYFQEYHQLDDMTMMQVEAA